VIGYGDFEAGRRRGYAEWWGDGGPVLGTGMVPLFTNGWSAAFVRGYRFGQREAQKEATGA